MPEPNDTAPATAESRSLTDADRDEVRIRVYQRLMDAQDEIAHARYARGVDHAVIEAALDASESGPTAAELREDLYLASLRHYIEALGGRLEVRAVFPQEAITVLASAQEPRARER